MHISGLYIYPIKSLGGISLQQARLTDRGFEYDRRWMLIDPQNRFLTQREHPQMALLQPSIEAEELVIRHKQDPNKSLHIPLKAPNSPPISVTVWEDSCPALHISTKADAWFSQMLGLDCRLVYMPDDSKRPVDPAYAHSLELTSFSDGYPLLIIGQASLDDLNNRLEEPLPMDRFRPNIVFTGSSPFYEDNMKAFSIANISFFGVKLCARCVMTLINQETATKGKEPLRTLRSYRQQGNKILFGQNLLFQGTGTVRIGDPIFEDNAAGPLPDPQ